MNQPICNPEQCEHCICITEGCFVCNKDTVYYLVVEEGEPTAHYDHCKPTRQMRTKRRQVIALLIFFAFLLIYGIGVTAIQAASAQAHDIIKQTKPTPAFASPINDDILVSNESNALRSASAPNSIIQAPGAEPIKDQTVLTIEEHFTQLGFKDSPLYNKAVLIAESCKSSGMDPYWFVVISVTESGAGNHCFKNYNAWGYGQYTWSSWEESIPAYTELFVSGYGSGLNSSSHWTYCPGGAYQPYV